MAIKSELSPLLSPSIGDPIDYVYSFALDAHEQLLAALGFDHERKFGLVTPGGTVSMLLATILLRSSGVTELHVLSPYYFPLKYHCSLLGIKLIEHFMERSDGRYLLPPLPQDSLQPKSAIWITNPVYCTGIYLGKSDIKILTNFLEAGGTLVADESLTLFSNELSLTLGNENNFIGMYSPHKGISINGVKFSLLVVDQAHQGLLERWADVVYGGLAPTAQFAIRHFLSGDFIQYKERLIALLLRSWKFLLRAVEGHSTAELDASPIGHFVTCYFPSVSSAFGDDESFLWRLTRESGAVFITGTRNHFNPSLGLCFRINLALDGPQFRGAITRLLKALDG